MKTKCPHCKELIEIEDGCEGNQINCKNCNQAYTATAYLNEVTQNLNIDDQATPTIPLPLPSSEHLQFCSIFLILGGIVCGVFINGMAGLIAFVGGAIMIALSSILEKLERIMQISEQLQKNTQIKLSSSAI